MVNGHYTRRELRIAQNEIANSDKEVITFEVIVDGKPKKYWINVREYRLHLKYMIDKGIL